jgi:adenylate cyclase
MKADARSQAPTDRLVAAIRQETLASLKRGAFARAGLAVALMLLFISLGWFGIIWRAGLTGLITASGAAQWRLAASRHHCGWHAYLFATLDAAVVTAALLWPNPLGPPMAFEVQLMASSQSFVLFTLLLVTSALSLSWGVVLYTGVVSALFWAGGILAIGLGTDAFLDPQFVGIRTMIQESAILILSAGILALAVARTNALMRRHARSESERWALARYFSPNMIDEIAKLDRPLGAVRSQDAAVLFADIVGFTRLSERIGAEPTMALLREFHAYMGAAVFAHNGTVDKYVGDTIMATFGTPRTSPADASNAVHCALAMIDAVSAWNEQRRAAGELALLIGIGVHYGPVVAGDMGDERRLEYAVIGDTVNVASRIESLTRERAVPALISAETIAAANGALAAAVRARLRRTDAATLRGRDQTVELWAAA